MDGGVYCSGGSRLVVMELSHIKELLTQLEVHLGDSPELCKRLASQIFSLTERSIGIITSSSSGFDGGRKRSAEDAGLGSATPSPLSDVVVDAPFKNNKKRKMMEKRKHQVRVSPAAAGGGGETTPVDDGHSWRKYGQKDILGAKHPRGYYRCTHRHTQGCAATKQVQRTDEDPERFDVIYLGTHTCVHKPAAGQVAQATQPPEHNPDAHSLLQNLSASLTVKTEGLAVAGEPQGWSASTPFRFSSTPLAPERRSLVSVPSTSENWGVSPATSDSNHVASFHPFDGAAGEAELQEVVAASALAAPFLDIDEDFLNIDISSYFA